MVGVFTDQYSNNGWSKDTTVGSVLGAYCFSPYVTSIANCLWSVFSPTNKVTTVGQKTQPWARLCQFTN